VFIAKVLRHIFSFKENIDVFSKFFFRDYASAPSADFHKDIYKFMFDPTDGALGAPRGHAKSTVVGLFFLSYCIVNRLEDYIVYVSSNHSKTVQFLDPIRSEFKYNERLKWVYGDIKINNVRDEDGKDREDCFDVYGLRVEAVSFEKNLRGFKYKAKRPTLIILDDIEDDQRVLNPDLRYKDQMKLDKIIIPSMDPEKGRVKMIGTVLHWDSLLIKKIRTYNGVIYKACDKDFENILWPEYWTEERLRSKFRSIGSVAFSSEFLNNPIENQASIIKGVWIDKCFNEKLSYEEARDKVYDRRYLGCDFAFGDRVTNDNSAYTGVGLMNSKQVLMRIEYFKGKTTTEQFDLIEHYCSYDKYFEAVMEENSIKSMSKNLHEYSFKYYLIWTGATDPASTPKQPPEHRDKRHTVGKKSMILRLATQFENGMYVIPYKTEEDKMLSNRLKDELMTYALDDGKLVEVGIHADIPMALAMVNERVNGRRVVLDV
jgi:hypothetical protein